VSTGGEEKKGGQEESPSCERVGSLSRNRTGGRGKSCNEKRILDGRRLVILLHSEGPFPISKKKSLGECKASDHNQKRGRTSIGRGIRKNKKGISGVKKERGTKAGNTGGRQQVGIM